MAKPTTKSRPRITTQTVRMDGKRVRLVTRAGVVVAKTAPPLEWELQAAQVARLRGMPEYGVSFLLAGDQNSARRGHKARAQALAAGMTAGEPDLRIYLPGGRIGLIENKVGSARLSSAQVARHAALGNLGHPVMVLRADSAQAAADGAEALVRGWLSASVQK